MNCNVEERAAHQSRQPGHGLPHPSKIKGFKEARKFPLHEIVSNLERVPFPIKPAPGSCEHFAERLHCKMPLLIGE